MCHVLIATTFETDRQFLKKMIRQDFFNVVLLPDASTTEQAIQLSKSHKIDLLILDVSPQMNEPFRYKTEILQNQPNMKTILIDSVENFKNLHKSLRCGAIDYLVRPLNQAECQQSIHRSILALNQVSLLHYTSEPITDNKKELTNQMIQYIHKNYQELITLDTLAAFSHLHRNYVSKLFKEAVGMTFVEYLTFYRLEQAKKMLTTTEKSVAAVAEAVGYIDPAYFSRIFKKEIKLTPVQYRQTYTGKMTPADFEFALS
ncbi:helix-turn-helix domain-containing protein [Vagococcus sp.]|uniref:helix-turn-helix domain-containing protein n=1 Tax=Vagococcus sp. TaxID=1933889 RepID=UPI003F9C32FB